MMGMFNKPKMVNRVVLLDLQTISSNPYQPRKHFEQHALQELAESIRENGLLQPITVREKGVDQFELVAGERRLKACEMLEMKQIPAIVETFADEKSATFALVENLQRKDLNYFEEAVGIEQLMQCGKMTQQQVAKKLGKAQSTVANKLRLLSFSQEMREKMLEGGLTERHARALLRITDPQMQQTVLTHIVEQRLNVGETERYIERQIEPKEPKKPEATKLFIVKDLRIFMNTIAKAVSTMKLAGIEVDTHQTEDEDYISYVVKVPKKSVYRARSYTA